MHSAIPLFINSFTFITERSDKWKYFKLSVCFEYLDRLMDIGGVWGSKTLVAQLPREKWPTNKNNNGSNEYSVFR